MTELGNRIKKLSTAIAVLAGIAIPMTAYLIYAHYKPEASEFCNFGENFSCEIVNQSIYAEIYGIPVSALGLFAYLTLFVLALKVRKTTTSPLRGRFSPQQLMKAIAVLAGVGTAFSLYLTYIEAFVLMTYCIFCLAQQVIILTIFILSLLMLRKVAAPGKGPEGKPEVCEFC